MYVCMYVCMYLYFLKLYRAHLPATFHARISLSFNSPIRPVGIQPDSYRRVKLDSSGAVAKLSDK